MNRQQLLKERMGFAKDVNIPSRSTKVGSQSELLSALKDRSDLYIIPERSFKVESSSITISSNKCLNGNGKIKIEGQIKIKGKENVIITGCQLWNERNDAITCGSSTSDDNNDKIWIHRNTFLFTYDGSIDILDGAGSSSCDYTISRNHFYRNQKACLWGRSTSGGKKNPKNAKNKRITHAYNYYEECDRRHPRMRGGFLDQFNNVIERPYAMVLEIANDGRCFSEENYYNGFGFIEAYIVRKSEASGHIQKKKNGKWKREKHVNDTDWFPGPPELFLTSKGGKYKSVNDHVKGIFISPGTKSSNISRPSYSRKIYSQSDIIKEAGWK